LIKAAVLGSPISHSLSPRLHNEAYRFLKIDADYSSFDVPAGTLENFLSKKSIGWNGFSLTMPLKEEAISIAHWVDPLVSKIASGNTLVRRDDKWNLFSTDVQGFRSAWSIHNADSPSTILILGSGATARAAVAAFDSDQTKISVIHRNSAREDAMRASVAHSILDFKRWGFVEDFYTFDLIINTTPKYALDEFAPKILHKPAGIFFDVIYDPWPTKFAQNWTQVGGNIMGGLDLLIAQGIEQMKLFTGKDLPTESLSEHLRGYFAL
jgi:shikimate dehydrogenase